MSVQHFLLVYDHDLGHLVQEIEFGTDAQAAVKRYQELEAEHRANARMDIVLVGSDSLDTIRVTHRNYFEAQKTMEEIHSLLAHSWDQRVPASG